eukprot:CAMPEP_0175762792 /NCGR_PEP_ID=MMETSP0097-20121207/67392_1 /TAXON_ID=311494 /ORGANISM="Alexandrium monilatum, Strain CCMP3105" /LENGTH=129 /DNA_ID=CAMNT_0017072477 /DNA_START=11 /DNA_END=397 /DNA_ORIENTATION=+
MPTLALPGGGRGARAQLRGRPAAGRWPRSPGHHVQGKRGDAGVGSSAGTKLNRSRGQAQRCTSHRKQRGGGMRQVHADLVPAASGDPHRQQAQRLPAPRGPRRVRQDPQQRQRGLAPPLHDPRQRPRPP